MRRLCLPALLVCAAPAGAQSLGLGDGSLTDNPDLAGTTQAACIADGYCGGGAVLSQAPAEAVTAIDVEWSLGLRGSFATGTDGERFQALVLPQVSADLSGGRSQTQLEARGELVAPSGEESAALRSLQIEGTTRYDLSRDTTLSGAARLSLGQDDPEFSNAPDALAVEPLVATGTLEGSVEHTINRLTLTGTLRGERQMYGESERNDGSAVDNSALNRTSGTVALRASYELTPILSVFAQGEAGYDLYDEPAPVVLVKEDGMSHIGRVGISGKWQDRLEAEVGLGFGVRSFDDPARESLSATLYDARVTYRPDETLTLTAGLSTNFAPASLDAGTGVAYEAVLEGSYRATRTLTLRTSTSVERIETDAGEERRLATGIGADYQLTENTALNADYTYSARREAGQAASHEHRVSVGVTYSR